MSDRVRATHRCHSASPRRGRRRQFLAGALLLTTAASAALGQQAQVCPLPAAARDSAGFTLVLSGGGARGIAHIGVLRVLDSLGLTPRMVVGTSMGALVGALYASGASGSTIDSLARALPLAALFRRYAPLAVLTGGDLGEPVTILSPAFVFENRGGQLSLQSPVAREPEINATLDQLLLGGNLDAGGDFDRLPIRFRAVATDMRRRSPVVLAGGDLVEAVRASAAIPAVLSPVPLDGRLLVDGGLSANAPVAIARGEGATRIVLSDVGVVEVDSAFVATPANMLSYLVDVLFTQPADSLAPTDVRIRPKVAEFGQLEFSRGLVGRLIDRGYDAAREALRGCAAAPSESRPAHAPRRGDAKIISHRLARLADYALYDAVWLRPSRVGGDSVFAGATDSLRFAPVATPAAQRLGFGGASYDGQEGARLWVAATDRATTRGHARLGGGISASAWRQQVTLTLTGSRAQPTARRGAAVAAGIEQVRLPDPRADEPPWSTVTHPLVAPTLSVTADHAIVRLYDARGRERVRPTSRDLVVLGGLAATLSPGLRLAVGPAMHVWDVRDPTLVPADHETAFGAMLRAARLFPPPTVGPDLGTIPNIAVDGMWLDRYRRGQVGADLDFQLGPLVLRPRTSAGWGDALPLGAAFALGGAEGFPGLRTGERFADRFRMASLAAMYPVLGPVYLRVEGGVARTDLSRARRPDLWQGMASGAVSGAEAGLAADTPLGPVSIAFGRASSGRTVFKIRFGS